MADETLSCVPTEVPVQETPPPAVVVAKPARVRKPKAPADPMAALAAQLDALTGLVSAQTDLITALLLRSLAPPAAPTLGPRVPGDLQVVGVRQARYTCPCVGRDGKAHGSVTINRFGNCPDCYTEAHFAKSRKAA